MAVSLDPLPPAVPMLPTPLVRQPRVPEGSGPVVIQANLPHPTSRQPVQQRGRAIDFNATTLAASTLTREDDNHIVTIQVLLRFGAVEIPNIADLRAPAHDAFVTLINRRVEHPLREVETNLRIENLLELAPARRQRPPD
jgi:hypothetical protein